MSYLHGHSPRTGASKTYLAWYAMRQRCNNPKNKRYDRYGGRGITICPEWDEFETFLSDMGEVPTGLTLERRDNNKGYSPDNCRWATKQDQAQNRRTSRNLTFQGKTLCVTEWARRTGINIGTLWDRLDNGWNVSDALSVPANGRPSRAAVMLTFQGETHCVSEWERILGRVPRSIHDRLRHGWTAERALSTLGDGRRNKATL